MSLYIFSNEISIARLDQREPKDQVTDSASKRFVRFILSKPEGDVGTMQPLLDDEAVEYNPPALLAGINLIYEVSSGSGGCLALRIHSFTKYAYDEELSATGEDFVHRSSAFYLNGIKSSANPVRRVKRDFGEWYEPADYEYHFSIGGLILLIMLIVCCYRCCCCGKSTEVTVNTIQVAPPDNSRLIPA